MWLLCAAALLCARFGPARPRRRLIKHPPIRRRLSRAGRHSQPGGGSNFPIASDARLAGDAKQTRFILDLDKPVPFRAFALADPYRVVVDLPQVNSSFRPGPAPRGGDWSRRFATGS